jgi:hypothetical protein
MNLRDGLDWNLVASFKKFMCDRPFEPYMLQTQTLTIETKHTRTNPRKVGRGGGRGAVREAFLDKLNRSTGAIL